MNDRDLPLSKDGTIIGMYLGWVIPDTNKWEALLKLTKSSLGYHINFTSICIDLFKNYQGIARFLNVSNLELEYIYPTVPYVFKSRIPVERVDIGEACKNLGLSYPGIDSFAFMARTGGRIHADPFSVCPILTPNADGDYEFYCDISTCKELQEHWYSFTKESKLECHKGLVSVQLSGDNTRYPVILPDFFTRLEGSIDRAEILTISQPSAFGVDILAKVVLSSANPYSGSNFSLLKDLVKL